MYEFDWSILLADPGRRLLQGAVVTLKLMVTSLILASVIGIIAGTARWAGGRITQAICGVYVEFARNTPPLVQILFWYFSITYILPRPAIQALSGIGFEFSAVVFALAFYHGGFIAEIVRAGLQSIPVAQLEASQSLGLTFRQSMQHVMFPQVFRIIIPPFTNEAVSLTKNTSLALAIGVAEITYQARYIDTYDFRGVEALTAATFLYLVICLCLATLGNAIDAKLNVSNRRRGAS
jgi:polar amino acid transport system permease protein